MTKIGLALSGGGALGAAHLGILEALDKENIKIDFISGTSSGAIIALLYADGGTEAVVNFYKDLSKTSGLFRTRNLLSAKQPHILFDHIRKTLKKNIKAKCFTELSTDFSCIATDVSDGKMTIFTDGDPVLCAIASAAHPAVFPHQKIKNKYYMDGGVTRNLPADVVKNHGANFIIGSSVYHIRKLAINEKGQLHKMKAMERALEIMEKEFNDQQLEHCHFCFKPPVHPYHWYDFDKTAEIIKIGRDYAQGEIKNLKRLISQT